MQCFCCDLGRWNCGDMGRSKLWWGTTVQAQLKNVQQICSTQDAFAAVLADGTVVAWGNPDLGGDSTAVQDQLNGVEKIRSTMSSSGGGAQQSKIKSCFWTAVLSPPPCGAPHVTDLPGLKQKHCMLGALQAVVGTAQQSKSSFGMLTDLWHNICSCCNLGRWNRSDKGRTILCW